MMKTTVVLAMLAGTNSAFAKLPPVLDRVPSNAAMVSTIDNIASFEKKFEKWSSTLNIFEDMIASGGDNPVEQLKQITSIPGLNREGSAAFFALMKPAAELEAIKAKEAAEKAAEAKEAAEDGNAADDEPNPDDAMDEANEDFEDMMDEANDKGFEKMDPFILVPVSDYAAFVKGLGGSDGAGIAQVKIDGKESFIKDAGKGYAILSQTKEPLERYAGAEGMMAAHTKALGAVGAQVDEATDMMMFFNIPVLRGEIEEGLKEMQKGAGEQMMPGMEQAKQAFAMLETMGEAFARDGSVGIMGLGLSDAGIIVDMGAQFIEGTELAKMFNEKGDTLRLVERLPEQEFFVVTAMDTSKPGVKKMLKSYTDMTSSMMGAGAGGEEESNMSKAMQKLMGPFSDMTAQIDNTDGYGMMMGATPGGLMGGLFVNTTAYVETKDPAAYLNTMRKSMDAANGQQMGGITIKTSCKDDAETLADVSVAKWSMQMTADGNDPEAQQMAMVQNMIVGPRGLNGFAGAIDKGVVMTYSDNKLLMTNAIEVARSGKGLGAQDDIRAAQAVLPSGRTIEGHLGMKTILETVQGVMGMMGGPSDWEVPETIAPISMGVTTNGGGLGARFYLPNDVIMAFKDMGEAMKGAGNPMNGGDEPMDDGSPDF